MKIINKNRPLSISVAIVAIFFLWLALRPELLFVKKSVDEPFPVSSPAISQTK